MSKMIKIGDRVKFLNDVGGGIVTGFLGKNMVKVENEDGFEVPYPVSKLINVDDPALNKGGAQTEKTVVEMVPQPVQEEKTKGKVLPGKDSPAFFFCFVPANSKNPVGGDIGLFLVNDSNFTVLFRYAHFVEGKYNTVLSGEIQPNSKEELEVIDQNDLAELPEFSFQLVCFRDREKEIQPAIVKKFRINPVKFYKEKSFRPNAFFSQNAMVYQIAENILDTEIDKLTEDDFRKVVKAKEQEEPKVKQPKPDQPDIVEVDLHIHELVDNTAGLSNKEILDIQMEKVEREMRLAIESRAKRIVFIHGVGQGVLKQEVAKLLKSKFPKYSFQDASFKDYGYGATMVMLRRR
jgi:DNA-nicking Smr family endonuclease